MADTPRARTPAATAAPRGEPRAWRADLTWGARQGAFFAAGFTALGVVGWLLGGPDLRADVRAHWAGTLAIYWGGGTLAGLLVGACRPRLHRRGAALLLGAVIGTGFMVAIVAWSVGTAGLTRPFGWYLAVGVGAPLGVACAWNVWQRSRPGLSPAGDAAPAA